MLPRFSPCSLSCLFPAGAFLLGLCGAPNFVRYKFRRQLRLVDVLPAQKTKHGAHALQLVTDVKSLTLVTDSKEVFDAWEQNLHQCCDEVRRKRRKAEAHLRPVMKSASSAPDLVSPSASANASGMPRVASRSTPDILAP